MGRSSKSFYIKSFLFLYLWKMWEKKTFQYDQSPLSFCAPFEIVVVVVVVVVVGLVVWGRLGAASAVLETCVGQGRVPSPPPWMDPWVGALLTSISCTISSRFFLLFTSISCSHLCQHYLPLLCISCTILIQFAFLLSNPCTISIWFISFLTSICCTRLNTYPTCFFFSFLQVFPVPISFNFLYFYRTQVGS